MKPYNRWFLGSALLLLPPVLASPSPAQPAPILHTTFEEGDSGWMGFGQSAKVSITREAANVKEGKAALQFDYSIAKGELNAVLSPLVPGTLAKAQSFRFWVKADHSTTLILLLQEQGGGRYIASFYAPKEKWQRVELAPSDFALTEGPDDPKDPNNRLDLDQVEAMGLGDLSQLFAQAEEVGIALGLRTGAHTLFVDDVMVSEEQIPPAFSSVNGEVRLDRFVRPQLGWAGLNAQLSQVEGKPLEGVSLKVDYRTGQKIVGFTKSFPRGRLTGTTKLSFMLASAKSTKLVVQLEETGGGKYNAVIDVEGGSKPQSVTLQYADFKPADDSKDTNDRLDIDKVFQIIFFDPSGFLSGADQENTIWLNRLQASP